MRPMCAGALQAPRVHAAGRAPDCRFDPKRRLSPHFRLKEFTRSVTAEKHQLFNLPREECELANLRALAEEVLEPARNLLGVPLLITSGYRCATLNRLIGGAAQSQHMVGEAADFIPKGMDVEEGALRLVMAPDLQFDQLIYEIRVRDNAAPIRWIHISHKRLGENRREALTFCRSATGFQKCLGIQCLTNFIPEANQNET